ncbi:MAG: NrsF family protein [Alphaproteobacteria bacterium]
MRHSSSRCGSLRNWAFVPMASPGGLASASGSQCWRAQSAGGGWGQGAEPSCFIFVAGAGAPITLSLLLALRRAAPLEPVRTALLGALGAAALCAAALQFFHPFDVTFLDLGFHAAAVALLAGLAALLARTTRTRRG